jgi:hypothetical protein
MIDDADDETLSALLIELTERDPVTVVLRPSSAFQLASLLQLALRHPGTAGAVRLVAVTFIEHVRQYFADAPTTSELLRQGFDPAFDRPSGAVTLTPSQRMALADILLTTTIQTPGHSEVHVDVARNVETTPEELLNLMIAPIESRPLAVRLRYRVLGGHVHCRVFTAPTIADTFVNTGELTFSVGEWPALRALLAPVAELLPEDE